MVIRYMPCLIRASGLSDIGLLRERNEDVWAVLAEYGFYLLADGMGGHQSGDVAAKLAVQTLSDLATQYLSSKPEVSLEEMRQFMARSIQQVNSVVHRKSMSHPALVGMGTTLCCFHLHEKKLVYAHVGDSRIYRLRQGKLQQLTKDHSLFRELVDVGEISEKEERNFGYKNVITKAVGTENNVEPSIQEDKAEVEDLYLICSDGLTDMLTNQEIELLMNQNLPLEKLSQSLVEAAKEMGGLDNITVIVIQVDEIPNLS